MNANRLTGRQFIEPAANLLRCFPTRISETLRAISQSAAQDCLRTLSYREVPSEKS